MKTGAIICLAMALAGISSDAQASLHFVDVSRSVSADNNQTTPVSAMSDEPSEFSDQAAVSWTRPAIDDYCDSWGTDYSAAATQQSVVRANGFFASGSATDNAPFYHSQGYSQSASSLLNIEFEVTSATEFALDLSVTAGGDWGGTCYAWPELWVSITGENGDVFSFDLHNSSFSNYWSVGWAEQFEETFLLDEGVYTLSAGAATQGSYGGPEQWPGYYVGGGAYVSYDMVLVPEPASVIILGIGGLLACKRRRV